jgi:hypothetical protein
MTTVSTLSARRTNPAIVGFIAGSGAAALAGAVLTLGLQPTTSLSDDFWRYPFTSSGAFVAFSIVSAVLYGLVARGLVAFGRSGAAGHSRAATVGVASTVTGTALFLVGHIASIFIRDARVDDTRAQVVTVFFALGGIISMIGFLLAGWATARAGIWHGWQRFTPLATGLWLVVLNPLPAAAPALLNAGVGIYGLCLLAMAIAMYTAEPRA